MGNEVILKQKALAAFLEQVKPPAEFKPVFETNSEREAKKQKLETVEDEKKNILKDLPEMDDEEIAEFISTELTGRLLNNKIYRRGIMAVIITNSLMIAIETDAKLVSHFTECPRNFSRLCDCCGGAVAFVATVLTQLQLSGFNLEFETLVESI